MSTATQLAIKQKQITLQQLQSIGGVNQKVLMPIIRQIAPGLIAQQIIGVQPMASSNGEVFNLANGNPQIDLMDMPLEEYKVMLKRFIRFFKNKTIQQSTDKHVESYVLGDSQYLFTKFVSDIAGPSGKTVTDFMTIVATDTDSNFWRYELYTQWYDRGEITDDDWPDRMRFAGNILTQALDPYPEGTELMELEEFIEDYL